MLKPRAPVPHSGDDWSDCKQSCTNDDIVDWIPKLKSLLCFVLNGANSFPFKNIFIGRFGQCFFFQAMFLERGGAKVG